MSFSIRSFSTVISALGLVLLAAGAAQAQATRTFVSGVGDDANPCSRTAPCKTFAGAISKTATGGEINCLDPGGFGTVTTIKSITLDCHEVFGSVLNSNTNGIVIATDSFTDARKTVRLRNLNISGTGPAGFEGFNGIRITGAGTDTTVVIEDCLIDGNFNGTARGIDDVRSGGGKLIVSNTTIRNNGGGGVSAFPASGSTNIQVFLNNVRSFHNGTGAQFGNGTRVLIDQSAFDGNAGGGIRAETGAIVNVDRSSVAHNADGIAAVGGSITLSNTNIVFNTASAVSVSAGGTVRSFGNNRISNNASVGTVPTLIGSASSDTGQQ